MDFYTVETAVTGALPTIAGIGAKATATIPDAVRVALLNKLRASGDDAIIIGTAPNTKQGHADVVATVTKFNKVSTRDNLGISFVLRTSEDKQAVSAYMLDKPVVKVTRNRTATS